MTATTKTKQLPRWKIFRIKGTPAAEIGSVEAPDAATAIKVAIEKFEITDPVKQQRLVARRIK
jgi:1,2-phenylacetyl-CoA epoxidase PaaB subunit